MPRGAQPDTGPEHIDGRSPGRPRDAAIDELVLRATIDLLAERGMEATTIQAVSDRSGIARATIYLRWPGRSALVLAALRWAIGRPPFELSGDIATDFQRGVERVLGGLLAANVRRRDAGPHGRVPRSRGIGARRDVRHAVPEPTAVDR